MIPIRKNHKLFRYEVSDFVLTYEPKSPREGLTYHSKDNLFQVKIFQASHICNIYDYKNRILYSLNDKKFINQYIDSGIFKLSLNHAVDIINKIFIQQAAQVHIYSKNTLADLMPPSLSLFYTIDHIY